MFHDSIFIDFFLFRSVYFFFFALLCDSFSVYVVIISLLLLMLLLLFFLVYGLDARGSVYILEGVVRTISLREWSCIYVQYACIYPYMYKPIKTCRHRFFQMYIKTMTIDLFCCCRCRCRCRCNSHFGAVFVYCLNSTHIVVCGSHVKHVCALLSFSLSFFSLTPCSSLSLSIYVCYYCIYSFFLFLCLLLLFGNMCLSRSQFGCVCIFSSISATYTISIRDNIIHHTSRFIYIYIYFSRFSLTFHDRKWEREKEIQIGLTHHKNIRRRRQPRRRQKWQQ